MKVNEQVPLNQWIDSDEKITNFNQWINEGRRIKHPQPMDYFRWKITNFNQWIDEGQRKKSSLTNGLIQINTRGPTPANELTKVNERKDHPQTMGWFRSREPTSTNGLTKVNEQKDHFQPMGWFR